MKGGVHVSLGAVQDPDHTFPRRERGRCLRKEAMAGWGGSLGEQNRTHTSRKLTLAETKVRF